MSGLGKRLRAERERRNLKQIQVTRKTGINNKTLSGYENGVSEPDYGTLKLLANLYEVSTDYLISGEEKGELLKGETETDRLFYEEYKSWDEKKKAKYRKLTEFLEDN